MRSLIRTLALTACTAGVLLGAVALSIRTEPVAAQDDEGVDPAEAARVAKEELVKAVARGKALFESRSLGRKSCKDCHDDPDKPEDNLAEIAWSYPAYSRRARRVVTLQQKINEMIKYKARGKELDQAGGDIADIAAYVTSIRK